jgi:hypothetical protein
MTKEAVRERLFKLFPGFLGAWNSNENYQKEGDGSFTYHDLFIEFSFFLSKI